MSRRSPQRRNRRAGGVPLFALLVAGIAVIGIVAVVMTSGGDDDDTTPRDSSVAQTRPVTVEGEVLPPFDGNPTNDAGVGAVAPTLRGQDFAGNPVTIEPGAPKAIAFLAHWCPHCRNEVPRIKQYLDQHGLPGGVELYFVSTRVSPNDPNYPPSDWLAREGLSDIPTIADDDASSAILAYGAGGFPYLVWLDADNRVVLRTSGEYGDDPDVYVAMFDALAAGERPVDPRL